MSVAVPAHNAAGQEALVYATVTDKPELPKVPQADASGKQRDQRDQERQSPKDHISERLQSMARLAERQAAKEAAGTPQTSASQQAVAQADAERQAAEQVAARQTKPTAPSLQRLQSEAARQAPPAPPPKADQSPLRAGSLSQAAPPLVEQPRADNQSSPASDAYQAAVDAAAERRARQPGPAELANLPDAVARYDSNGDGRIDQGEMKQVYRAKDERTSYAGLAQPRHPAPERKPFYQEDGGDEPKKLFAGEAEVPLPGEKTVSQDAPPLPGTAEAKPLYALPGEEAAGAEKATVLTPQERRALAEAQDPTLRASEQDLPPLFVPPEDRVQTEEPALTSEELAAQEGLLEPRKIFALTDEAEQRDAALQTYRQISEGNSGRSSIIA